ncbi:hypothetical protein MCERH10_01272 [Caulobacteraceae bacterium]
MEFENAIRPTGLYNTLGNTKEEIVALNFIFQLTANKNKEFAALKNCYLFASPSSNANTHCHLFPEYCALFLDYEFLRLCCEVLPVVETAIAAGVDDKLASSDQDAFSQQIARAADYFLMHSVARTGRYEVLQYIESASALEPPDLSERFRAYTMFGVFLTAHELAHILRYQKPVKNSGTWLLEDGAEQAFLLFSDSSFDARQQIGRFFGIELPRKDYSIEVFRNHSEYIANEAEADIIGLMNLLSCSDDLDVSIPDLILTVLVPMLAQNIASALDFILKLPKNFSEIGVDLTNVNRITMRTLILMGFLYSTSCSIKKRTSDPQLAKTITHFMAATSMVAEMILREAVSKINSIESSTITKDFRPKQWFADRNYCRKKVSTLMFKHGFSRSTSYKKRILIDRIRTAFLGI